MVNDFLLSFGFVSSSLDKCLYKRSDAIMILFCDDLRIGATPAVLASLHLSLFENFGVTTASGTRFLGMDAYYDHTSGHLQISMETYISTTVDRFGDFDISRGFPYRELVGCLLWITLCAMGPEIFRVKGLARRSNPYEVSDYQDALAVLAVLRRIEARKNQGIVIFRSAGRKEIVPPSTHSPARFSTNYYAAK
jgi:hypothetical protein